MNSEAHNPSRSARQTLCNMAVEFSAFSALIAPDEAVFEALQGRPFAPKDDLWTQALQHWQSLYSDADARFDTELAFDVNELAPMLTWGTSPQHAVAIDQTVPQVLKSDRLLGQNRLRRGPRASFAQ